MNWKRKVSKGLDQSKILLEKAKNQALSIGEHTLLNTELKELRHDLDSLYRKLGEEIYTLLKDKGRSTVSLRTSEIKEIFPELENLISEIKSKKIILEKEEKK